MERGSVGRRSERGLWKERGGERGREGEMVGGEEWYRVSFHACV